DVAHQVQQTFAGHVTDLGDLGLTQRTATLAEGLQVVVRGGRVVRSQLVPQALVDSGVGLLAGISTHVCTVSCITARAPTGTRHSPAGDRGRSAPAGVVGPLPVETVLSGGDGALLWRRRSSRRR